MSGPLLADAFAHHVWATLRLLDTCQALSPEQLELAEPGTFGSILDTLRHTVGADAGYLFVMTGGLVPRIDEDSMDLAALRAAMVEHGVAWTKLLSTDLDPDTVLTRHHESGWTTHAPLGIRLAQAVHHGTDHRSQVCTALTRLGVTPPDIDVWDYGMAVGRVFEDPPTS